MDGPRVSLQGTEGGKADLAQFSPHKFYLQELLRLAGVGDTITTCMHLRRNFSARIGVGCTACFEAPKYDLPLGQQLAQESAAALQGIAKTNVSHGRQAQLEPPDQRNPPRKCPNRTLCALTPQTYPDARAGGKFRRRQEAVQTFLTPTGFPKPHNSCFIHTTITPVSPSPQNHYARDPLARHSTYPLSMCSSSESSTPARKSGTQSLSLSRAEHASQQAPCGSFCGSYALVSACLARPLHSNWEGGGQGERHLGDRHLGYVPSGVRRYRRTQLQTLQRVGGGGRVKRADTLVFPMYFLLCAGWCPFHLPYCY